tara:strand:- start:2893 stop:4791 length:1899 start_codon:yes stop_codon:yes gene_type:complete
MKKIKLGKKIALLEDFSASDLSKSSKPVTPAAKTQPASIAVDKVISKPVENPETPIANMVSGEEVRAEIIKDVDAILNNLDALSKQITEAALLEADVWFKDDSLLETVEVINEEDSFLAKIFAKFAATKAYSTRMGNYSALLKKERKAEVTKIELGGQFDAKKVQVEAEMKDKIRDKFKTQINKVNQKDITPEAKKAIKDKIYAKRDELEKDTNKKIAEKIKAKREAITTKAGQAIKAAEAETKKMLDDNPIDNEKLTNQWEEYKLSQDNDHEIMLINLKAEANADADDKDEDQIEKDIKTAKEQKKKQEARAAERAKILELNAKKIKEKEAKEDASLDDKQKEAKEKIDKYISAKVSFDAGEIKQEEFDKVEKISASTFKDREPSISDEDSEKLYDTLVKGSGEKKEDNNEETAKLDKQIETNKQKLEAAKKDDTNPPSVIKSFEKAVAAGELRKAQASEDSEKIEQAQNKVDELEKERKELADKEGSSSKKDESVINEANDMSAKKLSKYAGFKEVEYEGAVYSFTSKELGKMQFQAEPSFKTIDGNLRDDELNIEVDRSMAKTAHAKVLGQIRGYKNIIAFLKGGGAEKYESGSLKEIEKYVRKFNFKSISESKLHESLTVAQKFKALM